MAEIQNWLIYPVLTQVCLGLAFRSRVRLDNSRKTLLLGIEFISPLLIAALWPFQGLRTLLLSLYGLYLMLVSPGIGNIYMYRTFFLVTSGLLLVLWQQFGNLAVWRFAYAIPPISAGILFFLLRQEDSDWNSLVGISQRKWISLLVVLGVALGLLAILLHISGAT